ncbi:MAG: hypothetical protein ABI696_01800 [Rubrivivax sp.]
MFASDGGSAGLGREPPGNALHACLNRRNRPGAAESAQPLRPGWWEVIVRHPKGRRRCEVDVSGRIARFDPT